jgi:hypothetical protein
MRIDRALPILVAVLAALGTFLLGMAKHNPIPPLAVTPMILAAAYFTDYKGWLRFNRGVANIAALAASAIAFFQFISQPDSSRLL